MIIICCFIFCDIKKAWCALRACVRPEQDTRYASAFDKQRLTCEKKSFSKTLPRRTSSSTDYQHVNDVRVAVDALKVIFEAYKVGAEKNEQKRTWRKNNKLLILIACSSFLRLFPHSAEKSNSPCTTRIACEMKPLAKLHVTDLNTSTLRSLIRQTTTTMCCAHFFLAFWARHHVSLSLPRCLRRAKNHHRQRLIIKGILCFRRHQKRRARSLRKHDRHTECNLSHDIMKSQTKLDFLPFFRPNWINKENNFHKHRHQQARTNTHATTAELASIRIALWATRLAVKNRNPLCSGKSDLNSFWLGLVNP